MIKIIIVDDHKIFRQGLTGMLQSVKDLKILGEADDGSKAISMIEELRPDIAVIDISMPGVSGLEVAEELRRKGISVKVIFLTMIIDPVTIAKALKMGIQGYVPKENAFEDLLYAIRAVAAGQQFISPSVTQTLHQHLSSREQALKLLSPREVEILKLIAEGMTSRQIGEKLFISPKTVENHRERIMQKLEIHKNVDLVRYAIANNLLN
jgi:DNA-binding NarL/FixJ family response regulator